MAFTDLENIIEMQAIAKLCLIILIISNFIIIFGLKLQIKIAEKFKSMFGLKNLKEDIQKIKTVCLIISHPEDELSYFSPTIKTLIDKSINIKILCLSKKNCPKKNFEYENSQKFDEISKILKMEHNKIIEIEKFEKNIIAKEIENFLKENEDIETIISFDENEPCSKEHVICYEGLEYYIKNHKDEIKNKGISFFLLDSFGFLSRIFLIFPFICFYFKENGYMISNYLVFNKWTKLHNVQMNFWNKIKRIFNGYSYFNSFTKVELQ